MLDLLKIKDRRYLEDLEEYLEEVKTTIKDVLLIVVFGSIARGKAKPYPESDMDLLVVARGLPERRDYTLRLRRRPLNIDDLWLTPEELWEGVEWGVILDALAGGIPLHDPENLFSVVSDAVKERYERIGRIWRLKP